MPEVAMAAEERVPSADSPSPDHLCVLVHGLWGNPDHLKNLAACLRERHPESELDILVPKGNTGNFTYDGIELGAERVTKEIEDRFEELTKQGHKIKKFSIVGYSLGGLVARYAIGILYSKGWFEKVEPVNFTTFATPHLGVRTPVNGFHHRIFNSLGGRFLSKSGHQLFTIDSFRDTGRPLLCLLADPDSIFIKALSSFRHRVLYANIINDRSAPYYTTSLSSTDPFVDLSKIKINYREGFDGLILDADNPASLLPQDDSLDLPLLDRFKGNTANVITRIPTYALMSLFFPIGMMFFITNGIIQSFQSERRIRLHKSGEAGTRSYDFPSLLSQKTMDGVFEGLERVQSQEYLSDSDLESGHDSISQAASGSEEDKSAGFKPIKRNSSKSIRSLRRRSSTKGFPTLALSQEQFEMIDALRNVGFRRYPVHIQTVNHTHAAIVVRRDWKSFDEGRRIIKHWLDEEFEI
ncbi:MAG: hypothetical protein M4579_000911 [Chaenotheca gracillima]|nr:MAG: hypothetical protein M4579_000911 [Chaenotheca gracillima]